VVGVGVFQALVPAPLSGPPTLVWSLGGLPALARTPGGTAFFGFMPVVPITLVSALLIGVVSALTPKPSPATISRYFPSGH
jgi:hypothetical protein